MTPSARTARTSRPQTPAKSDSGAADERWVQSTLRSMSLHEKIGQMLMVYYFGQFTPADSPEFREAMRQIEENHVGGFIVGTRRDALGVERSQVYPTAILANLLQRRSKIPLLVGADFERGTAMRLDEGTSFPFPMAVGATDRSEDAYTMGKITALEARAAGIHWVFAPDADVNDNPDNPIINIRSFGEDPQTVGEFVAAFVRGAEENGALATAKHFPGHGDVSMDSHLGLPVVPGDRGRLESVELVPFRAAMAAGVSSIMTGHLAVPAFEPEADIPATLSSRILTDLLRKELRFGGLVVTDALDMGGVTTLYPPGEVAVRTVAAGADMLLIPPVPDAAIAAIEDAAKSGRIPESRLDDAVARILRAKSRLSLQKNRFVDVEKLSGTFGQQKFAAAAQDIADRGITLLRDTAHLLPLDSTRPLHVLLVLLSADPDPYPGADFEDEIRWRVDSLRALRADTQFASVNTLELPAPDTYDLAIAGIFVRVADRKGTVGLPDEQAALVNRILSGKKPAIVACFGSPYLVARFPNAATWVASFSTPEVSQRAMARAIFGQVAIAGRIPVAVPGIEKRGDGLTVAPKPMKLQPAPAPLAAKLAPAYLVLDRGVRDHAFPGGVLAVGWKNQLLVHPFGRFTYDRKSPAVTAETIYDLASLTKPVVTTTAVMMLVAQNRLDLNAPVSRYLPEWTAAANQDPAKSWRAGATVRELLLHNSGLPAHRDFYLQAKGKHAVLARVFAEPLAAQPGTRVEYSDLGFILLGEIVERLTGESLDSFAKKNIFEPLAMRSSLFNPPRDLRTRIPPTEDDKVFRQRLLQGEVDDANAAAMAGVAGHAGLFSNAPDLAVFSQMLLNAGIYAHKRLLSPEVIEQFTARQATGNAARGLGWDLPGENSSTGRHFSDHSFGHLGFTGTSLWIDLEKKLFIILLTNRVYPSAKNEKIREVRPAVHDAVVEALGLEEAR